MHQSRRQKGSTEEFFGSFQMNQVKRGENKQRGSNASLFGRVFMTSSGNLIKGCVLVREASRGPAVHGGSSVEREAGGRARLNVSLIMTNPLSQCKQSPTAVNKRHGAKDVGERGERVRAAGLPASL